MRDFNHTVNVLVQAYLKDELAHSLCCACAVGNIVADSLGIKPKKLSRGATEFENNFLMMAVEPRGMITYTVTIRHTSMKKEGFK